MILAAAVKAIARRQGVDPMVIDLDHALGVVLWALSEVPSDESQWVFKGGTCLRKAYYRDYRAFHSTDQDGVPTWSRYSGIRNLRTLNRFLYMQGASSAE